MLKDITDNKLIQPFIDICQHSYYRKYEYRLHLIILSNSRTYIEGTFSKINLQAYNVIFWMRHFNLGMLSADSLI